MRPILLHCHLFKNAGTSIDGALQRSFGTGFVDHRDDNAMAAGGMPYIDRLLTQNSQLIAVSSHQMPFDPDYKSGTRSIWYLVMLREPIARALSVYHYERIQPQKISVGAKLSKRMSIREYFNWRLEHSAPAAIRNHHVRFLINAWTPDAQLGDVELQKALTNARQPQILVGIVERFDESMVMFERKLAGQFPQLDLAYLKHNVNSTIQEDSHAYLRRKLGENLFEKLLIENVLDSQLFAETQKVLDEYIDGSVDFSEHLRLFRQRCLDIRRIANRSLLLASFGWYNTSE